MNNVSRAILSSLSASTGTANSRSERSRIGGLGTWGSIQEIDMLDELSASIFCTKIGISDHDLRVFQRVLNALTTN